MMENMRNNYCKFNNYVNCIAHNKCGVCGWNPHVETDRIHEFNRKKKSMKAEEVIEEVIPETEETENKIALFNETCNKIEYLLSSEVANGVTEEDIETAKRLYFNWINFKNQFSMDEDLQGLYI